MKILSRRIDEDTNKPILYPTEGVIFADLKRKKVYTWDETIEKFVEMQSGESDEPGTGGSSIQLPFSPDRQDSSDNDDGDNSQNGSGNDGSDSDDGNQDGNQDGNSGSSKGSNGDKQNTNQGRSGGDSGSDTQDDSNGSPNGSSKDSNGDTDDDSNGSGGDEEEAIDDQKRFFHYGKISPDGTSFIDMDGNPIPLQQSTFTRRKK